MEPVSDPVNGVPDAPTGRQPLPLERRTNP